MSAAHLETLLPPDKPHHGARKLLQKKPLSALLLLLVCAPALFADGSDGDAHTRFGYLADPTYHNPQPDYWAMWRGLKMNTDLLLKTLGATNVEAAELLRQTQTNALFLESKWDVWFRNHNQPGQYEPVDYYLVILRADSRRLGDLKREKNGAKALDTVREIALDLQLKADNCRHSADGLGKEIKVKVHTLADGKEVGGFEVFCVPRGLLDVKSAHDRFARLSSPTDEKILAPGRYAMWVRRKIFTSEPITLGIGGHGETKLEVDIPVPSEP